MPSRKKPAKEFDFDAFSQELEQMAQIDKPAPPPRESELLKTVRARYDLLKSVIVDRGWTYTDVCGLLAKTGLEKGAYPRALKEALVKVAVERGHVWDDGRNRSNSDEAEDESSLDETEDESTLDEPEAEESDEATSTPLLDLLPPSKSSKFVEVPQDL